MSTHRNKKYHHDGIMNVFIVLLAFIATMAFIILLYATVARHTHEQEAKNAATQTIVVHEQIHPTIKDLTMPTGFRNLKWGDGIDKLKNAVLVTDNSENTKIAGHYVGSDLKEAPQCYIQKNESLKLGLAKLDEIKYCFLDNHFYKAKVYRELAYAPKYNEKNCNDIECLSSKDNILNNLFMDYLVHTYGVSLSKDNGWLSERHVVTDNTWKDSQGRNISFFLEGYNEFTLKTDYYDASSDKQIHDALTNQNKTTAEGNDN